MGATTNRFLGFIVLLSVSMAILYGVSYQQFRHFDASDPRGLGDANSYIEMSHGNYAVSSTHKYRFIVPVLAGLIFKALERDSSEMAGLEILSFYIVNFFVMVLTSIFFYHLLGQLGFAPVWRLLGLCFFLCSRTVAYSVGAPLVDSAYYLAITLIMLLTIKEKYSYLALLMPLLMLTKETAFLFAFLPLFHKKSMPRIPLIIGIAVAFGVVVLVRSYIDQISMTAVDAVAAEAQSISFTSIVWAHLSQSQTNVRNWFTVSGIHNIQHGFSFILVLAIAGVVVNRWTSHYHIPVVLWGMLPIVALYSALSSNAGRMIFALFPLVIPYALVAIEGVFGREERDVALDGERSVTQ